MFDLPAIIAHRGAPLLAPENTLASLKVAKASGATWVECDVMLTQDHVPIIMHDKSLARTTNGRGMVATTLYSEIAKLDAGSWFAEKYNAEKVPTLQDYLRCACELQLGLNLELKAIAGSEMILAEKVLDILECNSLQALPTPLLSSFSYACLEALHLRHTSYPLAYATHSWSEKVIKATLALACYSLHLPYQTIKAKHVTQANALGIKILGFTVNQPDIARKLLTMGVTSLFSDKPDLL